MTTASILIKVTVTLALALAGVRLARHSRASVRHLVLAAAFVVVLLAPVASVVVPSIRIEVPVSGPSAAILSSIDDLATIELPLPEMASAGRDGRTRLAPAITPVTIVLSLWVLGVAMCFGRLAVGFWQMRVIRRTSLPWRDGQGFANGLAREAGIRRPVDLLLHDAATGPMTCGVVRPSIILPIAATSWSGADFSRAIVHELEHVRRSDWVSQGLARVACACYWFHPLVWMAHRQLALEAERACDDAVLRRSEAAAYADQLVTLAQRLSHARHQHALGMARRADLAMRVRAVLDAAQTRGRARTSWVVFACAASALFVTTLSPLHIVSAYTRNDSAMLSTAQDRYDAVTIKPCAPDDQIPGPARGTAGGTNAAISPGRFNVPCVTTEQLIYLAYASYGAKPEERLVNDDFGSASNDKKIRGGPDWVHSYRDKYAIEASAAGATERTTLMGTMLRSLLEDRFKLKIHRESEEVPMFALTLAKGGFKLKPMQEGECDPYRGEPTTFNPAKPTCGMLNMNRLGSNMVWTFGGFKVSTLASQLARVMGRHVIDRTGLTDSYIMRVEFSPDDSTPGVKPIEDAADVKRAPSIFKVLEQEFGLKLESVKAPREFIVIDHVERPR